MVSLGAPLDGGSSPAARRRALQPTAGWFAVLLVVGAVAALVGNGTLGALTPPGASPSATFQSLATTACNPPNTSPSALDIPLPDVGSALAKGSTLRVSYEVGVTYSSRSVAGRIVYLPSLDGVFPVSGGGTLTVFGAPRNLTLSSDPWSAPTNLTKTLTATENLSSATPATLTSSKIAVMSNTTYGLLTLEFRWKYIATAAGVNATARTSPWSIPNASASAPYLPSTFFPADLVALASVSPVPAVAGSVLTLKLTGAVVNTTFRIVVEYPSNGTETFSEWEATPVDHGPFYATANLSFRNSTPLPAASYLIHVHDHCEAIVIILTVSVVKVAGIVRLGRGPASAAR
jgi:hypothetical protein